MLDGRRITRRLAKVIDEIGVEAVSHSSFTLYRTAQQTSIKKTTAMSIRRRLPPIKRTRRKFLSRTPEAVKGYVYGSGRITTRIAMFNLHDSHLDHSDRKIPDVKVDGFFNAPEDATIYHSFIKCHGSEFSVYGFTHPGFDVNHVIKSIQDVDWRGDVVIFQLGINKPLLRSPVFKKVTVNKVATKFASTILRKVAAQH
ncbi:hypothetical protein NMY22_g2827 [Coprinellus aureogranulatus]|nr:hypothetical protein NMY22_g2827 [Coprinellus aureogranulatus]